MSTARLGIALGLGLTVALTALDSIFAQPVRPPAPPLQRPGEIRPELPAPGLPKQPGFELPPLPAPTEEDHRLSRGPEIVVHEFRITGGSMFSEAELAQVTAPYLGHPIASEQLHELRDRLTRLYVDAGYLNSGAVLPDQDVREGVVEYRIIEGRLAELSVEGNRWFRTGYLESRIRRGAHTPLDVKDLENELQLLQQDPRIRRVDAELVPGERPGEARLRARFEEALPFYASLEASNYESPSVGSYRGELNLGDRNLTGFGDTLRGLRSTSGWTVTGNSVSPVAQINFPQCTGGSATASYFTVGTASSGAGKLLHTGPIGTKLGPFTAIAAGDVITIPGLTGVAVDDRIAFFNGDPSGLPTGITEGTVYFVKTVSTYDITVSTTQGGATVDITAAGDGLAWKITPIAISSGVTPGLGTGTTIVDA